MKRPAPTAQRFARFVRLNPLLPFAGAAVAGIAIADRAGAFPSLLPLLLALALGFSILAVAGPLRKHGLPLLALTASSFAVLHAMQLDQQSRFPLAPLLGGSSPVTVEATGIVVEEPTVFAGADRCRYVLELSRIGQAGRAWRIWHRIAVDQAGPAPSYGDEVRLRGELRAMRPPRNPGEFRFDTFLARKGIVADLRVREFANARLLAAGKGNPLYALALESREWIRATITRDLEGAPGIASVLQAMVLGDRKNTPEEIEDGFRHSGALHIFAVSGLHVGIFGTIIWTFLKLFGVRRSHSVLVIIPCLFFYAYVTGLRPSAFRAAIMASVFLWGFVILRPPRLLNSLAVAALLILALDTQQLFMPGFQLSFAVLASIGLLAGPIQKPLQRRVNPDPFIPTALVPRWRRNLGKAGTFLAQLFSVSTAAWIGSAPLGLWHFHLVTPIAVLANCVLVPLAWLILVVASLSILFSGIGLTAFGVLFNNANWGLAKTLLAASSGIASLPGSHFYVDPLPEWRRETCRITVLDTGLGGAAQFISVTSPRREILVDAGGPGSFHDTVLPFLRGESRSRIEALVITHGDVQHIGGAVPLLDHFPPATVIESPLKNRSPYHRDFNGALAGAFIDPPRRRILAAGDTVLADPDREISLRVLYPPAGLRHDYAADDQCLILQLACGPWRILFMSDSGFTAEKWLLENVPAGALRSDVIIKGRHRTDFNGLPEFLNAVRPGAVISSNASFPETERIPRAWEELLAQRGIALFDQSKTGAVTIRCSRDELEVDAFLTDRSFIGRTRESAE